MGRMIYWMNVSIDLMIEYSGRDHTGADDGPAWAQIDDQLYRDFNDRGRALAMIVEGRKTYELMDPYWPDVLRDESAKPLEREWAEIWTTKPKVLVSNTRTSAEHNTRVIGGEGAIAELAALRDQLAGDIVVGGADLATQLLDAKLIDELVLYTHPAVLGGGRPLFDAIAAPVECELIEQRAFGSGVVLSRYQLAGQRRA